MLEICRLNVAVQLSVFLCVPSSASSALVSEHADHMQSTMHEKTVWVPQFNYVFIHEDAEDDCCLYKHLMFFFFFFEESRNIWCEEQPVHSICVMSPVNGGSWDYKTHSCEDDSLIWNTSSRRRNVRLRWDLSSLHFPKEKKTWCFQM